MDMYHTVCGIVATLCGHNSKFMSFEIILMSLMELPSSGGATMDPQLGKIKGPAHQ